MAALLGETGGQDVAQKVKTRGPGEGPIKGMPTHVVWAAASALALVISAAGLFAAGYFTHDLVTEDDSLVVQPSPSGGTPSAQPTALATTTPRPVVQVSIDDAPSWGPADAEVTIVEFSDYQ
jgi:protein-disulfide isomerase